VPAGELLEWAWLIADLADWLDHTDAATRIDFDEFFSGYRSPAATAWTATRIAERIAALLEGIGDSHEHRPHPDPHRRRRRWMPSCSGCSIECGSY
jgi:hypothetical protein